MADPKTELFEHLVQRLNATTGDTQAQAAVAAEFLIMARPERSAKLSDPRWTLPRDARLIGKIYRRYKFSARFGDSPKSSGFWRLTKYFLPQIAYFLV
jgi:hypothetical protein